MKKLGWIIFGFFSIVIGLYPSLYGLVDMSQGYLGGKSTELLESTLWNGLFYLHIGFGAISMLTGWTQFSKKLRSKNIDMHRLLGKIYVLAVIISGLSSFYLSFYATGGLIAGLGFSGMALSWLGTTAMAFVTVKNGDINAHQNWMIRSYATCWAAVTLRLWLPLLQAGFGMEFISAYLLVSWLSWVPNLVIAEVFIAKSK